MAREAIWERRGSGVSERRVTPRGGRRAEDGNSLAPNPDIPCSACAGGIATIFAISYRAGQRTTLYRCLFCRQFQKRVEP
jgi:hypothetical protein